MSEKDFLRVITLSGIVIALASVIQASFSFIEFYRTSLLVPLIVYRIIQQLLMFASLFLLVKMILMHFRLK